MYMLISLVCRWLSSKTRSRICSVSKDFYAGALAITAENPVYKKYAHVQRPCARCACTALTHTCWRAIGYQLLRGDAADLFTDYHTFVRISAPCKLKHAAAGCLSVFKLLVRTGRNDYSAAMARASVRGNMPVVKYLGAAHLHEQHPRRYSPDQTITRGLIRRDVYEDAIVRCIYADDFDMVYALCHQNKKLIRDVHRRIITSARLVSRRMYEFLSVT